MSKKSQSPKDKALYDSLYIFGESFFKEGEYEMALRSFEDCLNEMSRGDKKFPIILNKKGLCEFRLQKYWAATESFREASKKNPQKKEYMENFLNSLNAAYEQSKERGEKLMSQGNCSDALKIFNLALTKFSKEDQEKTAEMLNHRGICLYLSGNYQGSVSSFSSAAKRKEDWRYYHNLSVAYNRILQEKNSEDSSSSGITQELYKKTSESSYKAYEVVKKQSIGIKDVTDLYVLKALIKMDNDSPGAKNCLDIAIGQNSGDPNYFRLRALIFYRSGCYEECLKDLHKEISLRDKKDRSILEAYLLEGMAKSAKGDFLEALKNYDQALKISNHYKIYYRKALTLDLCGRHVEAFKLFNKILAFLEREEEKDPGGMVKKIIPGELFYNDKMILKPFYGKIKLQEFPEFGLPDEKQVITKEALIKNQEKSLLSIIENERKKKHYDKDEKKDFALIAMYLSFMDRFEEALIFFKRSLQYFEPKSEKEDFWREKLRCEKECKKYKEAEISLKKIINMKDKLEGQISDLQNLASIYEKQSKFEKALRCYDELTENYPDNICFNRHKAILSTKMGKYDQNTVNYFLKVLETEEDPVSYHNLGVVLYQNSQFLDALYYCLSSVKNSNSKLIFDYENVLKSFLIIGEVVFYGKVEKQQIEYAKEFIIEGLDIVSEYTPGERRGAFFFAFFFLWYDFLKKEADSKDFFLHRTQDLYEEEYLSDLYSFLLRVLSDKRHNDPSLKYKIGWDIIKEIQNAPHPEDVNPEIEKVVEKFLNEGINNVCSCEASAIDFSCCFI